MNREIKFRAWDNDKGRWLDQDHTALFLRPAIQGGVSGLFLFERTPNCFEECGCWNWGPGHDRAHVIVGQFTGLKDKNGRDIYEGDILRTPGGQLLAVTIYDLIHGDSKFRNIPVQDCCIVGNVWEQPELLTSAEVKHADNIELIEEAHHA